LADAETGFGAARESILAAFSNHIQRTDIAYFTVSSIRFCLARIHAQTSMSVSDFANLLVNIVR
jgi:hypothetical protein